MQKTDVCYLNDSEFNQQFVSKFILCDKALVQKIHIMCALEIYNKK